MKKNNLIAAATKGDIDEAVAQIAVVIQKEVNRLDEKIIKLDGKVDDVAADVSDIRRRVIDLETDTVSRRDFNEFKTKLLPA